MDYTLKHLTACGLFRFFLCLTVLIDKLKTGCGKIKLLLNYLLPQKLLP